MGTTEILLLLLLAICVVAYLAQRVRLAAPIAFVLAGMALATLPAFRDFRVEPELLLLLFLPPILTEAAYFTSLRDFKRNLNRILSLAIGLVLATAVVVACLMQWLMPEFGLAAGFVLGAIISPPDAVAAVAVTKKIRLPKRVAIILEGESLINDATGLVLYKFAVLAVVTGSFSLADAGMHFLWMASAGTVLGLAMGYCYMRIFPLIKDLSVEILSTLLLPYVAYIAAEAVHASGVLAVVASGVTVGWYAPRKFSSSFRIPAEAVWKMVTFVLNGLVFLLIGLHFPGLLVQLRDYELTDLLTLALAVSVAAIVVRVAWVYAFAYIKWPFRKDASYPKWQNVFIVAWTGMRGVVSLATALALPLTIADGSPFPHRALIIFLAFSVILVTLVLQGMSLPWIMRKLTLFYDHNVLFEEWQAKKESALAVMEQLQKMRGDPAVQSAALERIISHYADRLESLGDGPNTPLFTHLPPAPENHPLISLESRIWREVLETERRAVIGLRHAFHISDDVMHDRLRDIDLLHNRFANTA
ncbi:MAG: Na+/H+ antiporter [Alphaproteobacteria bacterium]|nr:Na+/H+ antiporter [Alphaproteobacteria bacterium]